MAPQELPPRSATAADFSKRVRKEDRTCLECSEPLQWTSSSALPARICTLNCSLIHVLTVSVLFRNAVFFPHYINEFVDR